MNKTCMDHGVEKCSVVHCLLRCQNESYISKWWDQSISPLIKMNVASSIIHRHCTPIAHAFTGPEPEKIGIPMNFTGTVPLA